MTEKKYIFMRMCPCPRISGIELTEAEFIDMQNVKREYCRRCLQMIEYSPPKELVQ